MEADIELTINLRVAEASVLLTALPEPYAFADDKDVGISCTSIRYASNAAIQVESTLGDAIEQFLSGLEPLVQRIAEAEAHVIVALYYSVDETVVLPLRLTQSCIHLLSQFRASLDVTGYPCSE